jgi:hypothetical protein
MGLTSGSTRWLSLRATSHAVAVGFCLSWARRARPGHVSAPDPCLCRDPLRPGTLPRPGPHSGGPGMSPRELQARTPRGPVFLYRGRTQQCFLGHIILLLHVVPLGLPMWWGRVPLSMRPGGAVRVQHLHTVEEGTPDSGYRQWPPGRLRGGCESADGAKV